MANAPYRAQRDLGLKGTIEWLADWYGDDEDFSVECLFIPSPEPAGLGEAEIEQLEKLQSRNQSKLHCYLKFAAMKWLEVHSTHPETIASEVICYAPIKEFCRGRRCLDALGREIDIRSAHILYDNAICFPLSYGKSIRLDLHSFDTAAEVGGTQPVNLLMPLLEGLADQSLWLPYPRGVGVGDFQRCSGGIGSMRAYMVRLLKAPRARSKRSPEMNSRGPHGYAH